jgi:hypothetical protein
MSRRNLRVTTALAGAATVAGLLLWVSGLGREKPLPPDAVFAIGDRLYFPTDLEDYVGGDRFASLEEAERAALRFVDHLLLRREAARRGPEAEALADHEVLALLVEEAGVPEVTEDAIAARYQDRLADYVHPRSARLAYFRVPRRGDPDAERLRIRSLYVEAQMNKSPRAFADLLSRREDGVARGEVGPVRCDGSEHERLPRAVVRAGCELAAGALGAPIETPDALFLVRKLADYAAKATPLSRVRRELRKRLESQAQRDARDAAREQLRARARVQIQPATLARLVEPAQRAPRSHEPEGPPRPPQMG